MTAATTWAFEQADLCQILDTMSDAQLDALDFGVIGFDAQGLVQRYSAVESRAAGIPVERVLMQPLFDQVAQCMNNYLVAQRFEDAAAAGEALDDTLDYVLTLRMRPTPVKLRLLSRPQQALRYLAIHRKR